MIISVCPYRPWVRCPMSDKTLMPASLVPSSEALDLEKAVAGFFVRYARNHDDRRALEDTAMCLVRMNNSGHSCLPLPLYAGQKLPSVTPDQPERHLPALDEWRSLLSASGLVGQGEEGKPLVLDSADRLYLYRHWHDERVIAHHIHRLTTDEEASAAPLKELQEAMRSAFADRAGEQIDWQRVAVALALSRRFCIISGAPGTGKTTMIVKLLAVYKRLYPDKQVGLAAPTGRAAARIRQAIVSDDSMRDINVSTIHRLLGLRPDTDRQPNTVREDLLIVDEASMISLSLMARLLESLSEHTRLVLVGDRDQLYSIAAGSILADLCLRESCFSTGMRQRLHALTEEELPAAVDTDTQPLADSIVLLRKSYRFDEDSGIAEFSQAINNGDEEAVMTLLRAKLKDVIWHDADTVDTRQCIQHSLAAQKNAPWSGGTDLRSDDAKTPLQAITGFRILSVLREGARGVHGLNTIVRRILFDQPVDEDGRYTGRQIMLLAEDSRQKLHNGDIGIFVSDRDDNGKIWCALPDESTGVRLLSPFVLPAYEDAWALTVHKSQGSEFDRVLLILPPGDHPLLSRELIYTAVTRARSRIEIYGNEATIRYAVRQAVSRHSGLADRLAGMD